MLRDGFSEGLAGIKEVVEIRGQGLMLGIELDRFCGGLVKQALEAGMLINVTNDTVIRLLPPLIIDEAQAKLLVGGLCSVIDEFLAASDSSPAIRR